MSLFEKLFGINFNKGMSQSENSGALSPPIDDEGAAFVSSVGNYGVYLDTSQNLNNDFLNIQKYREISLYPEIDIALQDIINEAVPQEQNTEQVKLITDRLPLSDEMKKVFDDEFVKILSLLDYNRQSADIFRRWYVDGRLNYQIIVNKENPSQGIVDLRLIDAAKIKKVKDVKKTKTATGANVVESVSEYFIYNENGFIVANANNNTQSTGLKISADSICYVPSGYNDLNTGLVLSYLYKAIRPINQLRMLEDSTVVYQIARAPERRIFYVDVGTLPKLKAEQYMKEMMNRYRNKIVYDASTGQIKDDKKYMSMLEDYWMPRRDNSKGTEITTLPGVQNMQGMLDNLEYFKEKVYNALNIPVSRLKGETGFSIGRSQEISRDEVKFQKFVDRLRNKFAQLFYQLLKTQLRLKGICNEYEWETEIKNAIGFQFQTDNYYSEIKELDIIQSRMALMPQIDPYLGKYFSKEWVQKNILRMSDIDIIEMDAQIDNEKDDPTAKPTFQGGGFGGDPNDPNAQGDGQEDQFAPQDDQSQGQDNPYPFQ